MTIPAPPATPFDLVTRLTGLAAREDRAALAALRRGLGKPAGTVAEMYPYVEPFLAADAPKARIEAAYLVASLFGLHPHHAQSAPGAYRPERGLGASLHAIRFRAESNEEDEGVARRFVALLDCEREALPTHLRHLVTLLKSRSENTSIDYRQLFRDILDWDTEDRRVQRAWASGFWGRREIEEPNPSEGQLTNDQED